MNHQKIFITGASSGIGEALARAYAGPGVTLGLGARRIERLQVLKQELESRIENRELRIEIYQLDVTDGTAVVKVAQEFATAAGGLDLVIANAGVGGWVDPLVDDPARMVGMVDVNVTGVIHTVTAFARQMKQGSHGHIAVTSSIAGFKPLPGGVYPATKAAVRYLMEGWRAQLERSKIAVTMIYPGFVSSEMTRSTPPRQARGRSGQAKWYPFLITARQAARVIKRGIEAEQRSIIVPWQWRLLIPLIRLLPTSLLARFSPTRGPVV